LFQKETTHQRQLVKITSAILNAFHFRLTEEGLGEVGFDSFAKL
jgi:hypothetical protein